MSENKDNFKKKCGQEKSDLRKIKELGFKAKTFTSEQILKLITEGAQIIKNNIEEYRGEFEKYFKKNPLPILGFDLEENQRGETICGMMLLIKPDLSINIDAITLKGPPSIQQTSNIEGDIMRLIKSKGKEIKVIIHGFNPKEQKMLNETPNPKINTQNILDFAKEKRLENYTNKSGLHSFEERINFLRKYCGFIKDVHLDIEGVDRKQLAFLFPSQSMNSLVSRSNNRPQRTCGFCGKPQDVLLYCLEDVFISLLILAYYSNRGYE